jgi:hypothetical protein
MFMVVEIAHANIMNVSADIMDVVYGAFVMAVFLAVWELHSEIEDIKKRLK